MGGDLAPGEIVAGAVQAAEELDVRVLLVGLEDAIAPLLPSGVSGVELVPATEVVGMKDPPAVVRTRKDSSVVVSAELVRDGKADAMTSAGNTGAAMAAALLRMGRIKGAARPAIAVPIPVPGRAPQILVDGGATVDCTRRVAPPVRGHGPRVRPHPPRDRRAARRPPLQRRGAGQGRRPPQGRVPHAHVDAGLHRQRRGPRLHARHRRRDRHRRLHRQRRAQDRRGRDPRHRPPRVRHADVHPRAPAGVGGGDAGAARAGRHAQPRLRRWLRRSWASTASA